MSTVRLIRGFAGCMKEQKWGRIINITSISVKQPVPRLLLSNAYRAAVTGFAKTLASELGPSGITVNSIAPGYIDTARLQSLIHDRALQQGSGDEDERILMTQHVPAGRLGMPSEVGTLAAFLASDLAAYINGSTILVDGGLYSGTV
jgi:3-oxoacyl-[acyl-carrier protein] reductase